MTVQNKWRGENSLTDWDMIGALATIAGAVVTSTIGSLAIILSLNPEWIADKKLLRRIEKNRRLKDVCLSICISKCGVLVIEQDLTLCIVVQSRAERMGLIVKTHLRVAHGFHSEVEELLSIGLLRRLESDIVNQFSAQAFAGYEITGEWLRLSEKMEEHLIKYRVGESLFSQVGTFIDDYWMRKVNSLYINDSLCEFPDIRLKTNEHLVFVSFVPVLQARNREYAVAFFPGHGYGLSTGSSVTFHPRLRPVNIGEAQFNNLERILSASIETVAETTSPNGQPFTRVGLCYTNEVFNA